MREDKEEQLKRDQETDGQQTLETNLPTAEHTARQTHTHGQTYTHSQTHKHPFTHTQCQTHIQPTHTDSLPKTLPNTGTQNVDAYGHEQTHTHTLAGTHGCKHTLSLLSIRVKHNYLKTIHFSSYLLYESHNEFSSL